MILPELVKSPTLLLISFNHPGRVSESGCFLFLSVTTISFMAYIAESSKKGRGVQLSSGVLKIIDNDVFEMTYSMPHGNLS